MTVKKRNRKKVYGTIILSMVLSISMFASIPIFSSEDAERDIILVRTSDANDLKYIESLQARVLESYDSFTLIEIDSTEIPQLERMGMDVDMMEHRTTLHIRDKSFDFTKGEPDLPDELRIDEYEADTNGQYIVHMLGPIARGWRSTLEDMGVQVLNYMDNYAYRVCMTPEQARDVSELKFVDWVGIYHPYYKLQPDLNPGMVNIGLVSGASRESLNTVGQKADVISFDQFQNGEYFFTAFVDTENALNELARIDDVLYITEHSELELQCEMSTQIIGGGLWFFDDDDNPDTAYRVHGDYGSYMNQIGYEGEGQVIAIADSGLGNGTVNEQHLDFQDRVVGGHSYRDGTGWEDGYGHGSHCAGSAAANTHGGTGDTVYEDYYAAQGSAPSSELFVLRIFSDYGGYWGPSDIYELVKDAYEMSDAYVHTNSWGTVTGDGTYTSHSSRYDKAARDFDMVITAGAGNNGPGTTSIIRPGTGKNLVTVGATTTYNPSQGVSNPENMASFSSRGWAADNRVKPDVVAPGQEINSTRPLSGYQYMSGTSMATPAAAGAAAVIVEWYEIHHVDNVRPSPAMVKALMINTAEPIDGNTEGPIPNRDEGWGMVDISKLERPLNDPVPFSFFDQEHIFTSSGEVTEYTVSSNREDEPMKFSLVWTDKEAPGDTGSGTTLINDLNLEVEAPNGDIYRGNAFASDAGDQSTSNFCYPNTNTMSVFDDSSDGWDDTNNVQNVYIHPDEVETGLYTVRVRAENIADDGAGVGYNSQDYALAVYNSMEEVPGEPPEVTVTRPVGGEVWDAGTEETIEWYTEAGDDPVDHIDLYYSIDGGINWESIATEIPDTGSYTWDVPNVNSDECQVRAEAVDQEGRTGEDTSAVFSIVGEPPAPPENLTVEHYDQPDMNYALNFDGDSDPSQHVRVGMDGASAESGTISLWFRLQNKPSDARYRFFGHVDPSDEWNNRILMGFDGDSSPDGNNEFYIGLGDTWDLDTNIFDPEVDVWYHVALVYDDGNYVVYKDGTQVSSGTYTGLESVHGEADIGNTGHINERNYAPEGLMDDARIFDRGLSQAEIEDLYEERYVEIGDEVGWWPMNEGSGDTVYDESTNDNHGAINGPSWVELTLSNQGTGEDNLLTWNNSPDDPEEVAYYNIYRCEDESGPWDENTLIDSIDADGSSEYNYVDLGKGTGDDILWWYVVRAVGANGLEEQNTDAVQEPEVEYETFDIDLYAGGDADGWNFVSFNLIPTNSELTAILEDAENGIEGSYEKVMYYDPDDGWQSYIPGRADHFNDIDDWDHTMGLWIRMNNDDTLTIEGSEPTSTDITLNPGWNMVGLPSESTGNHNLPLEVDKIGYFDATVDSNLAYDYDPGTFSFEAGEGYWIHNPTDTAITWTVDY